ncbi:hypothetical protein ES708_08689 [subsurface metagenome]
MINIKFKKIVINVLALGIVIAFLFPYFFMVTSAFKSRLDTFAYPPVFFFFKPTLNNFVTIFRDMNIIFYMKTKIAVAARPPVINGRVIRINAFKRVQPSTIAASSNWTGILSRNPRNNQIE